MQHAMQSGHASVDEEGFLRTQSVAVPTFSYFSSGLFENSKSYDKLRVGGLLEKIDGFQLPW